MKKWFQKINFHANDALTADTFTENSIFFDIETTGFSPAYTHIYLIGCARREKEYVLIEQFFAESAEDEKEVIAAFLSLLENYSTILTFNGIGFDIPYLKAKCDCYQLEEHFSEKEYLDFFKIVSSLKFLLKLPNYKQKSLETFLGIHRKDVFNGGELINIYKEYCTNPSEEAMYYLKQHNFEDVLGMIDLIPILSYSNFLRGGYSITSIESSLYTAFNGEQEKEIILSLENDIPVPKRVSYGYHEFYLTCNGSVSKLSIRLFDGELKFFFENYQDYYYLPEEDTAIHKNIASFVEKEYRKKATATNCYTRKNSIFVPQYEPIMNPAFRVNYKDKISYFELSRDFTESDVMLRRYVSHVLKVMSSHKKNA